MNGVSADAALAAIWQQAGSAPEALDRVRLSGTEPALPSSFAVGTAAQVGIAAAALAATELGRARNGLCQSVGVDLHRAALESTGRFTLDGRAPTVWDPIAGLYPCGRDGGHVRLHTNFAHHRDGVLRLLELPTGPGTPRVAVAAALLEREPFAFESAASAAGLVVAAVRDFAAWDAQPQSHAVAGLPLVAIERLGGAPPLPLPDLGLDARPLDGVRVLELTRILAGPVAGRTLAAYGADVLLVNSPELPNIEAIADTSRGKRSALADLSTARGRDDLDQAVRGAHVFLQGYRPGALAARGYAPGDLAALRPGIVVVSLSAYGETGPWGDRRGFDSLVQTATGFNAEEARAAGSPEPRAMPVQILDMATGFLLAFGTAAALLRQQREGGSWHVRLSLARTALWLRSLGRVADGYAAAPLAAEGAMETSASGYGELVAMRHAAELSRTPPGWTRPSMPPGTHRLDWPETGSRSR